jgi:hypothetical protein
MSIDRRRRSDLRFSAHVSFHSIPIDITFIGTIRAVRPRRLEGARRPLGGLLPRDLVGGCVASYTSDDTYVDTGAIAVTLAMMALALGGSVWVAGLLVIKIFVKEEA